MFRTKEHGFNQYNAGIAVPFRSPIKMIIVWTDTPSRVSSLINAAGVKSGGYQYRIIVRLRSTPPDFRVSMSIDVAGSSSGCDAGSVVGLALVAGAHFERIILEIDDCKTRKYFAATSIEQMLWNEIRKQLPPASHDILQTLG